MEENKDNIYKKGDTSPLIYITMILVGMALITFAGTFAPVLIFGLLFLTPFAFRWDMELAKPISSVGLIAAIGIFLYFNQFDFSLYKILVVSTGLSVVGCYIIWRFFGITKFSDGLIYSILLSLFLGIVASLIIFLIGGRQSFAVEIVKALESWILRSKSSVLNEYVNIFYNYIELVRSSSTVNMATMLEVMSGTSDLGSELTRAEKLAVLMPYLQNAVNIYAISAMLFYPAFAGAITWWRGSYRFYKQIPMDDDNKELKPKPFSTFTIPRWLFGTAALLLILSFILQLSNYGDVMFYAANVSQSFAYILLIVQGFAVMEYFLKRTKVFKSGIMRIILMAIITILTSGFLPMLLGGMDMFFNIRLVYVKSKELKEKLNNSSTQSKSDDSKK